MGDVQWHSHKWPAAQSRGALVIVHGTGEHHGRYEHVAAYVNERGWDVYTGDLPGWGRSPGKKGHIESFSQYIEAVRIWTEEAVDSAKGEKPVFLLGHSLGGLVATRFVQIFGGRQGWSGLILTSPCLELKVEVPAWKTKLARWLDRMWPSLTMENGITPDMVSRDSAVQAAYRSDPLNYSKVSVRWFQELHKAMGQAWEARDRIKIPLLVLQAGEDALVCADAVRRFVEGVPGDAQFQRFPGLRHEVLNEPERESVLQRMVEWMDQKS